LSNLRRAFHSAGLAACRAARGHAALKGCATACATIAIVLQAAGPHVGVTARSIQPGEVVLVTIDVEAPPAADRPAVGAVAHAFGHTIPLFKGTDGRWQALVGIDLDVKPGRYPLAVRVGATAADATTYELVVQPKTFRTRRLTVDPNFVTPPPSAAERIARDNQLLHDTWRSSVTERLWSEPFVTPVEQPANSAFGTRSIFNGQPRNAHGGADFLSPAGTPVHAPNRGRVAVARDLYFSGNTVIIDHGLGAFSMLAHLSAFDVHEGDTVAAGQVVGRVGATGRVTGPHLHWAVRLNDARVDPLSLLDAVGAGRGAPAARQR
jgi:hypothetical protein